jgi:hypothetical protein
VKAYLVAWWDLIQISSCGHINITGNWGTRVKGHTEQRYEEDLEEKRRERGRDARGKLRLMTSQGF